MLEFNISKLSTLTTVWLSESLIMSEIKTCMCRLQRSLYYKNFGLTDAAVYTYLFPKVINRCLHHRLEVFWFLDKEFWLCVEFLSRFSSFCFSLNKVEAKIWIEPPVKFVVPFLQTLLFKMTVANPITGCIVVPCISFAQQTQNHSRPFHYWFRTYARISCKLLQ